MDENSLHEDGGIPLFGQPRRNDSRESARNLEKIFVAIHSLVLCSFVASSFCSFVASKFCSFVVVIMEAQANVSCAR